eukprot:5848887-Pyramimonas_sp.AAC.1
MQAAFEELAQLALVPGGADDLVVAARDVKVEDFRELGSCLAAWARGGQRIQLQVFLPGVLRAAQETHRS